MNESSAVLLLLGLGSRDVKEMQLVGVRLSGATAAISADERYPVDRSINGWTRDRAEGQRLQGEDQGSPFVKRSVLIAAVEIHSHVVITLLG